MSLVLALDLQSASNLCHDLAAESHPKQTVNSHTKYITIIRQYQVHEMRTTATDVSVALCVCQSACNMPAKTAENIEV